MATVRGLGVQIALGWERNEVETAWAVARDDYVAGFHRAEASRPQPRTKG